MNLTIKLLPCIFIEQENLLKGILFMPIYEYICKECGCGFEKLVPRAGTPVECEKCGSKNVEKQFSLFGTTTTSQTTEKCASADSCPAAAACGCHGKCGCHH